MKIKALFVCIHRPNRSPSQRFRFEQYLDFLQENDVECHYSYLLNKKDDVVYYHRRKYLQKAFILAKSTIKRLSEVISNNYDVVFVQKECYMLGTAFFEYVFSLKSKLIFDFDDAIWMRPTGDTRSGNQSLYFFKRPSKTKNIIQTAHLVIAGNDYLANYAKKYNDQVRVIPTVIDTDKYKPTPSSIEKNNAICIGWSGSFSTITHFEYIIPVLEAIKKKYKHQVYFKVIGDGTYQHKNLSISGVPWSYQTELQELSEIDIGIMPLPNDSWTQGKCGFKGLLYMSMGIPAILSPVGVNKDIISDGENGFLAESIDEWVDKLSALIENADVRKQLGEKGRNTIVKHYSLEANKQSFLSAFREVLSKPH